MSAATPAPRHPPKVVSLVLAALTAFPVAACGQGSDAPAPPAEGRTTDDPLAPWADIDTRFPSEDPVATVYGYVQAMAAADPAAACAFQYRGSSEPDPTPCVLAEEMPARDLRFTADDWARFAEYSLTDYEPVEDAKGWKVTLPAGQDLTWRIRQDDAGIWFIA